MKRYLFLLIIFSVLAASSCTNSSAASPTPDIAEEPQAEEYEYVEPEPEPESYEGEYEEEYEQEYEEEVIIIREFPHLFIEVDENPFYERNVWQDGTLSLINIDDENALSLVPARIRGRGNSTWWMGEDKRPLRIRFPEPRTMMGSAHAATDWILLANHFDQSLLRNYSALHFARYSNRAMHYVPMVYFVHVYINGEYFGLYNLTDERDVNEGRMRLTADENPEISDYFLQLDFRQYQSGVENEDFVEVNEHLYQIRYPNRLTPAHVDYVKNYLYSVSNALREQDDEVFSLINLASWVDFYIVQELFKNKDIYQASVFMHISGQGEDRRLYMGPVWDFDLSAGNMASQYMGTGPEGLYVAVINYWFKNLIEMPIFYYAVVNRWNELSREERIPQQTVEHIAYLVEAYLEEFERNFVRHPIPDTFMEFNPPEIYEIGDNFMGHAEHLINWLEARIAYMNRYFRIPR